MFDVSNDVKCYGVLSPVPQKIIDGQAFDNTFSSNKIETSTFVNYANRAN